jgi:putative nucleotidyltransferase with HDIG domain
LVLSIIAESLIVLTPGESGLSVGFAVALSAIMIFGIPEAMWISTLGIMLRTLKLGEKRVHILNYPLSKTLFNAANIALSSGFAGLTYVYLGGVPGTIDLKSTAYAVVASILVCLLVNAIIISILMHYLDGSNIFNNFFGDLPWTIKDYFSVAPLGILMAVAYISYGVMAVLLFFIPLLYARYSFKLYFDMKQIYIDTVKSLSQAVEAKDPYTNGHSMRVGRYSCKLAERLGLSKKRIENLRIAAILHDIGKIGIEEGILNKPGRLSDEEYDRIKQHPEIGVKIITDINFLADAAKIIISHHERYDGTGYPAGRKVGEILLESQILSLADVFDALTSERPYRSAMTVEEALEIIENGKGSQFDYKLADAFIKMVKEDKELMQFAD